MATEAKLAPGALGDSGKEICRAFRNTGSCRFENECKYEHSVGTKIDVPPREYIPKGDCHNWTENGECRFADRCRFVHGTEDKRSTYRPERKTTETGEQEICHNYQTRGRCRWGERCRHKHVAPENGVAPAAATDAAESPRRRQRRRRGGRKPAAAAPAAGEAKTSASAPAKKAPAPRTIQVDKDGKEVCRKNLANKCENGTECKYSHEAVAGTAPAPARAAPAASTEAPAEGAAAGGARRRPRRRGPRRARGAGAEGAAAPAAAAAPRAPRPERECQDFAAGECSYGDDCKFKHGPSDTRDLAAIRRVKREAARKAAAERKAAGETAPAATA